MFKKLIVAVACAGMMVGGAQAGVNCGYGSDSMDQKIGGAGGIEFGFLNLNMDPIEKITKKSFDVGGFDFNKNTFFTVNAVGYAGPKRNGVRIGVSGMLGYNSYMSDEWTTSVKGTDGLNENTIDSVIQLHVVVGHIGFLAERSFRVSKNFNFYAGSMLGGGCMVAIADRRESNDAFKSIDHNYDYDNDSLDTNTDRTSAAWAPLWAFDVHGGATYSLTNWMHVGIDGTLLVYYSSSGFDMKYGSFWNVNPGVRVRLIFGTSV